MKTVSLINEKDRVIGIVVSILCLLFLFLFLYFTTFEKADPSPMDIPLETQIPLTQMVFKNLKVETSGGGGGGGGRPSDAKVDPLPKSQTEKILTTNKLTENKVNTGQSKTTTSPNSQNESSSVKKSINPFSNGGDGEGTGGGVGRGSNVGFGNDDGPGRGEGNGIGTGNGTGKRIRLNDPNVDNIDSDENHKINLRVKIDEDGNVISAISTSRTTTTSQIIINKVISATISQVKYNKKPGAGVEEQFISISIRAK